MTLKPTKTTITSPDLAITVAPHHPYPRRSVPSLMKMLFDTLYLPLLQNAVLMETVWPTIRTTMMISIATSRRPIFDDSIHKGQQQPQIKVYRVVYVGQLGEWGWTLCMSYCDTSWQSSI
jgi:hypothetical protein